MAVNIKSISGWKWLDLDALATSEEACQEYFALPKGVNDITTNCIGYMTNVTTKGEILFYYIADSEPSQFIPILGEPESFEIIIIT
jgi:hypothetical protein